MSSVRMLRLVVISLLAVYVSAQNVSSNTTTKAPASTAVPTSWQTWYCLGVVVLVILGLGLDLVSAAAAMYSSSLLLMVAGVISTKDFISGFSTTNIIAIAHLLIVVDPLCRLPLAKTMIELCLRTSAEPHDTTGASGASDRQWWGRLKFGFVTMVLSAFANQVPTTVLAIPLVMDYCKQRNLSPSRLLMTLSMTTALGGSWTLVGTTINLTYAGLMQKYGVGTLPFFELMKVSAIPGLIGLAYAVIAPEYLVDEKMPDSDDSVRSSQALMTHANRDRPTTGEDIASGFVAKLRVESTSKALVLPFSTAMHLLPHTVREKLRVISVASPLSGETRSNPIPNDYVLEEGTVMIVCGGFHQLKTFASLLRLRWMPLQKRVELSSSSSPNVRRLHHHVSMDAEDVEAAGLITVNDVKLRESASEEELGQATKGDSEAVLGAAGGTDGLHKRRTVQFESDLPVARGGNMLATDGPRERFVFLECTVSYENQEVGKPLNRTAFLERFRCVVVAIHRKNDSLTQSEFYSIDMLTHIDEHILQIGDTLLLFGPPADIEAVGWSEFSNIQITPLRDSFYVRTISKNFVEVPLWFPAGQQLCEAAIAAEWMETVATHGSFAMPGLDTMGLPQACTKVILIPSWYPYLSAVAFLVMTACTAAGMDIFVTSAVAVFCMIALRLMTVAEALRCIDLNVMTSVIYSFGIGAGMTNSGLASVAGDFLTGANVTGFKLLLLITVVVMVLSNLITNRACAQLIFPIVVAIFNNNKQNPFPVAVMMCVASCWSFITPYAKPSSLLVFGPGKFTMWDFVKFGTPITVVLCVAVTVSAAVVYQEW